MSNSKLATYTRISPYKYERQQKITGIIIHHMAGKLSAAACGNVFQWAEASANYGIGYDGTIGLYVPENYSAWSAASYYYDQRNISIELSNDSGAPNWHVSDLVINKCIDLCVDICKRNGIKKLNYTGDLSGNLLMHCWTAATACVPTYTEVLTKDGWKRIDEVELGEQIACATLDGMNIIFDEVFDKVPVKRQDTYETRGIVATKDHRFVYKSSSRPEYRIDYMKDLLKDCETNAHYIPLAGHYHADGLPLTDDMIRFYIAVQADGHYMYESLCDGKKSHYGLEFHLKKERKIERVKDVLDSIGLSYKENHKADGSVSIRVYNHDGIDIVNDICEQYLNNKEFTWEWLELSEEQAKLFLEEILLWDGSVAGKKYSSHSKTNLDIVNAIAALNGVGSRVIGSEVMFRDGNHIVMRPAQRKTSKAETEVTCVTVSTGLFLARQKGKTFIIGNCPGPYMKTKFKYIADEVNKKLAGYLDTPKLLGITAHIDGAITIRWSRVQGAYKYRVFRRLPGETWKRMKDVAASSYKDTTCAGGTKYIYTVRCVDKNGKYVSSYDSKGVSAVAKKVPKTFTVQTTKTNVKIYKSADTASAVVGKIVEKGVYTIVDQKNGMGKLKSGAGWINLADTKRI